MAVPAPCQNPRLDPGDPAAYNGLSEPLCELERYTEAESAAYCSLGDILFEMRRDSEAATACKEAIRLAPENPDAYKSLGDGFDPDVEVHHASLQYAQAVNRHAARCLG